MVEEEKPQEFALKGLLEETERLVGAYNETLKRPTNNPELQATINQAQATIKENLTKIVNEIEQIDSTKVPIEAKNIIEGRETRAE